MYEGGLDEFVVRVEPQTQPGTFCQYNSADTQALGMMLVAATGRPIADYMFEKLGEPLGMESPGYWIVDGDGMETLAFLRAVARQLD